MAKRLFMLRRYPKGPSIDGLYFDNKSAAKAARNQMGGTTVVSLGPDHRNFASTTEPKGGHHNAL